MSTTSSTHDPLEYNEKYSVLICRKCKYAVQKSALGSHLLRHKIYRGERQRLLSSIAGLELLEPDDVQLPAAGSPPVNGLPIVSGHRCTATGCESLYASAKRMRDHWSKYHGEGEPPASFSRPANLQTFFRGTKLRYFEVASSRIAASSSLVTNDKRLWQQDGLNLMARPTPRVEMSVSPSASRDDSDMEKLRYFHHFTTQTILILPTQVQKRARHCQIGVVELALRQRWLMYGLLAISASHLAVLSDETMTKRLHWARSARFDEEFSAGWEDISRGSGAIDVEVAKAGAQMVCIQRCYEWAFESSASYQGVMSKAPPFQSQSFMLTIRGCIDPDFALLSAVSSDDIPSIPLVEASKNSETNRGALDTSLVPNALLDCLHTLPYRMTDAVPKPDSSQDVFAALFAIDTLVECCSLSYASDEVGAVWTGIESWIRRLPEHFNEMIRHQSPAALIVQAHWSLLVKRAEGHCWFLRGLATKLLRHIAEELRENSAAQRLVKDLTVDTCSSRFLAAS